MAAGRDAADMPQSDVKAERFGGDSFTANCGAR